MTRKQANRTSILDLLTKVEDFKVLPKDDTFETMSKEIQAIPRVNSITLGAKQKIYGEGGKVTRLATPSYIGLEEGDSFDQWLHKL